MVAIASGCVRRHSTGRPASTTVMVATAGHLRSVRKIPSTTAPVVIAATSQ